MISLVKLELQDVDFWSMVIAWLINPMDWIETIFNFFVFGWKVVINHSYTLLFVKEISCSRQLRLKRNKKALMLCCLLAQARILFIFFFFWIRKKENLCKIVNEMRYKLIVLNIASSWIFPNNLLSILHPKLSILCWSFNSCLLPRETIPTFSFSSLKRVVLCRDRGEAVDHVSESNMRDYILMDKNCISD